MSLLAALFDWQDPAPPVALVGALLSGLRDRAPDGRWFSRLPHALLGVGARYVRPAERQVLRPFCDARRGICVIADARLDNRDELNASLSDSHGVLKSDVALIAAAYERWGHQAAEHLIGDFAFVIWDSRNREVYAARDPFGVRSLVYHRGPGRLIVATEPAQLLALREIDRAPNPQVVVDFLSWSYAHYGPTFFEAIRAVPPGHYLHANVGFVRETEYFQPPSEPTELGSAEQYREEFRALLRRSVKDRLESDYPVVAHLSGGLDSSSIVCTADRLYRDAEGPCPPFHVVSAVFPGYPYDEATFIEEVTRMVGFPAYRWDGNEPSGREFSQPSLSSPGASVAFNGGSAGDIEIASRLGARVLLSGDPGDAVTGENGLFDELLSRRSWITLAQQIVAGGSAKERRLRLKRLKHSVREDLPPQLLRVWRALNSGRRLSTAPDWLRPDLTKAWIGPELRSPPRLRTGTNRLQQRVWDYLRWARVAWAIDLLVAYAASAGIEARFPLLDIRLVRFVLSVPVEYRLLGKLRRTLHREAMVGVVPQAIAMRSSKAAFNGAVVQWGYRSRSTIRDILESSPWYSDAFVDQDKIRAEFRRLTVRPPEPGDHEGWLRIRSVVNLETWLRAVFRYPLEEETLPMSEIAGTREQEDDSVDQAPRDSYTSPKLTPVGNVRELLALDAGSDLDSVTLQVGLG